jgi:hypothetical protein
MTDLPPTLTEDVLWRSFDKLLNRQLEQAREYIESGVDDPIMYNRAVGRIWGLKFAKLQLIELGKQIYKSDEES